MASIVIRDLPDEVHHMLKLLAKRNKRSTEAEARHIIKTSVMAAGSAGLGQVLTNVLGDDEFAVERPPEPLESAAYE